MATENFQIPKGYEDFVSSKETLLQQFKEFQAIEGEVIAKIFVDTSFKSFDLRLQAMVEIEKRIQSIIVELTNGYIWHNQPPTMFIILDSTGFSYLQLIVKFGDNIEDEWFLVYLLLKITKLLPEISVQVSDEDGEFLMIEASDYVDDWLSPDNSLNRIWIKLGKIMIIPLEAPGKSKQGVNLQKALEYLFIHPQDCIANNKIHSHIYDKTTNLYPAKIPALDHYVVCIIPSWLKRLFDLFPELIAQSIQAFCAFEKDQLSSQLSKISLPQLNDELPLALSVVSLRFSRLLYAQVTFKKFKIPRKFHGLMRRVNSAGSTKVTKAFDIGCRLLCGLELFYHNQNVNNQSLSSLVHDNYKQVNHTLKAMNIDNSFLTTSPNKVISSSLLNSFSDLSIASQESIESKLIESIKFVQSNQNVDIELMDKELFNTVIKGELKQDSEQWLYLDPEELDSEMEKRIQESKDSFNKDMEYYNQKDISSENPHKEPLDDRNPPKEQYDNNQKIEEDESVQISDKLQGLVDEFKGFLKKKSDYEGIQLNANKVTSKSFTKPTLPTQGGFQELDMNYLQSVLSLNSLSLTHQNEKTSNQSAEFTTTEAYSGVAEKALHDPSQMASESNQIDSDDEEEEVTNDSKIGDKEVFSGKKNEFIVEDEENDDDEDDDDDADEDDEDGFGDNDDDDYEEDANESLEYEAYRHIYGSQSNTQDNSNKPFFEENEQDFDHEEISIEEYQRAMDNEVFGEGAIANTFAELLKQSGGDLNNLDDEDLDMNFLTNLLQSQAEGLGNPVNPFQQLFSQLGIQLPRPPPMKQTKQK